MRESAVELTTKRFKLISQSEPVVCLCLLSQFGTEKRWSGSGLAHWGWGSAPPRLDPFSICSFPLPLWGTRGNQQLSEAEA